jgi:hypothetical protein
MSSMAAGCGVAAWLVRLVDAGCLLTTGYTHGLGSSVIAGLARKGAVELHVAL